MLRVIRCALVVLSTVLSAGPALADPPNYRVELLDTGQFAEPSQELPAGGFLTSPAFISPNGRYVVTRVGDNAAPAHSLPQLVAILDRETGSAELIAAFERPYPYGINDAGAIALTAQGSGPAFTNEMHYWSRSTGIVAYGENSLPAQFSSHGALVGYPRVLNNFDQVLVQTAEENNALWNPVTGERTIISSDVQNLDILGIQAHSLNNLGQVVGKITLVATAGSGTDVRPFIWDEAGGLRIVQDLALIAPQISPILPFGRWATANAINDAGMIAGETRDENWKLLGIRWQSEATLPALLPCTETPASEASRPCAVWLINEAGDLVGGEDDNGDIGSHTIWDGSDPSLLRDLIVEGPTSCNIRAIADDGTLAGTCGRPALVIPIGVEPEADAEAPLVSDLVADPNPAPVPALVRLTANVDDTGTGGSVIVSARASIDGGPAIEMFAEDGAFDQSREAIVADLPGLAESGIYDVCVTGTDSAGNVSAPVCTSLLVFDADGGFVTGGGWIDVAAGALVPDPAASGRANFGFVAKYQKSATTPQGVTLFQFQQGDLRFQSTGYDWLLISEQENTAQYMGMGRINGEPAPNGLPYRFGIRVHDGDPDSLHVRIWRDSFAGEVTVFDSGDTALGHGSIVIHKPRK